MLQVFVTVTEEEPSTGPPKKAASTLERPITAKVKPVLAALPVVCSTNQEIATPAIALPVMETALEDSESDRDEKPLAT